jgi:HEPN domain-containing protein
MSDPGDPYAWVKYAEEDFQVARSVLRRRIPLTYTACFHAQQCAEKYFKAILVSRGVDFPKAHDLLLLSGLCEKAGILIGIEAKQLHALSDYAVRARYPGDEPTPDEAKEAVEIAKSVRRFVRKLFGVK